MTGDSIFNLLRIGEVDTDENDKPFDPAPKIKSVEVGFWSVLYALSVRKLIYH